MSDHIIKVNDVNNYFYKREKSTSLHPRGVEVKGVTVKEGLLNDCYTKKTDDSIDP